MKHVLILVVLAAILIAALVVVGTNVRAQVPFVISGGSGSGPAVGSYLLLNSSGYVLLNTGGKICLEASSVC